MANITTDYFKKADSELMAIDVPDLVIYHGGCPDGTAAAWCFWDILEQDESKFHYGRFNEDPPDVTNKYVLFVDFTYDVNKMHIVCQQAKYVQVLDHHKSAQYLIEFNGRYPDKLSVILDMDRSGAQIAWDFVSSGRRPWQIEYIADRDLWRWSLPHSREVCRAMDSMGYFINISNFSQVFNLQFTTAWNHGKILLTEDEKQINELVKSAIDCIAKSKIDPTMEWRVKVVECDYRYASEVGSRLTSAYPCDFAAMFRYNILKDEWAISLRASDKTNIDLTQIIPLLGNGGGHPKAAGMTLYGSKGETIRNIFYPVYYR